MQNSKNPMGDFISSKPRLEGDKKFVFYMFYDLCYVTVNSMLQLKITQIKKGNYQIRVQATL